MVRITTIALFNPTVKRWRSVSPLTALYVASSLAGASAYPRAFNQTGIGVLSPRPHTQP